MLKRCLRFGFIALFCIILILLFRYCTHNEQVKYSEQHESLLEVTHNVTHYSNSVILQQLAKEQDNDLLNKLLVVSKALLDPDNGISINKISPDTFMIYDMLETARLGFLSTIGLSPVQKLTIQRWHEKYMQTNPADVFFAPSASEIIATRAAFGCTHYARAFMAVVKALELLSNPEDIRYVISSKADDYNQAMENQDLSATINGHQFVIVRIDSQWIAINTSKGESTPLPVGFDPDSVAPPHNIPIRFQSYPDIVFLIRKIGTNWDDSCGDNSLSALMNISRSGASDRSAFLWDTFAVKK
ncbi:hypothetical protein [Desulfovibrio inopinatus]|uniref:hypothetical protein n=1 Tax=Desulfovibrio inopinatus TaxID=102109 RepID=UPI0004126637|nr:hypothetical protein [Desulfovibrio inopinatus]